MSENKSNKGIIIALIAVIVVLIIGGAGFFVYYEFFREEEQSQQQGIVEEPNMFFNDEDAEEYMKDKVSSILVSMSSRMTTRKTEDGKIMIVAGIDNKNDFQCKMDFEINGELIAETGLVQPGASVPEVELKKDLEPGTYEVNVIFTAISTEDNQTSLGAVGSAVDLIVK